MTRGMWAWLALALVLGIAGIAMIIYGAAVQEPVTVSVVRWCGS